MAKPLLEEEWEEFKGKTTEEFVSSIAEQTLGIQLDETQRKFLRLIKEGGVCVNMTKEARNNKRFQELVDLLFKMGKDGTIPVFKIKNS